MIGNAVGGLATFLGIFVTAFVGMALMKRQGALIIRQWQSSLNGEGATTSMLAKGVSLAFGAILMLLPGYATDFIGLLCFIPGLRVSIGRVLIGWLSASILSSRRFANFSMRFSASGEGSPYHQPFLEPNGSSDHARQHPLKGDVIEGNFKSKENPKR